jgi:hypothetical protein
MLQISILGGAISNPRLRESLRARLEGRGAGTVVFSIRVSGTSVPRIVYGE